MRSFFYSLILPHQSNNHRARFLHPRTLILIILFFVFSSFFFPSDLNPYSKEFRTFADVSIQELINLTNQKREENGLLPLSNNSALESAANKKAEDMLNKGYWAHNSPDGVTPWVFIKESGYNYVYAGENLARGFSNSEDVINAWMSSTAGHRENILSPNFKDVGFSVKSGILDGEETMLVVQELGSKVASPVAEITGTGINRNNVFGINVSPPFVIKPNFSYSSEIVLLMIFGFIAILLADVIIVKRKKIVRFVGHNFDHILFLIVIIFAISLFNSGAII